MIQLLFLFAWRLLLVDNLGGLLWKIRGKKYYFICCTTVSWLHLILRGQENSSHLEKIVSDDEAINISNCVCLSKVPWTTFWQQFAKNQDLISQPLSFKPVSALLLSCSVDEHYTCRQEGGFPSWSSGKQMHEPSNISHTGESWWCECYIQHTFITAISVTLELC